MGTQSVLSSIGTSPGTIRNKALTNASDEIPRHEAIARRKLRGWHFLNMLSGNA